MCSSHPRFSAGSGSTEETGAAGSGETSEARALLWAHFLSVLKWAKTRYTLSILWVLYQDFLLHGRISKVLGEMFAGFSAASVYPEATGASAPLTPLFAGKAISETQTRSTSAEKAKLNLRHAPLILVPSWVKEAWDSNTALALTTRRGKMLLRAHGFRMV